MSPIKAMQMVDNGAFIIHWSLINNFGLEKENGEFCDFIMTYVWIRNKYCFLSPNDYETSMIS